jgi:hypothetical protein
MGYPPPYPRPRFSVLPHGGAWALLILFATAIPARTPTAADLGRQVLAAGLDPAECYHVRDIRIRQEDATFVLLDGYLIFGKPVNGAPVNAVFTTDVEGGDAEVVLLPPDRAERRTLAAFTGSPNLEEHFTQALFFFTDAEARSLAERVRSDPSAERSPSYGALMSDKWGLTVASLMSSFDTRIVLDLLTGGSRGEGFFDAVIRGRTLGDFDVTHDARASEQLAAGKVSMRDGAPVWETWTRFAGIDHRGKPAPEPEEQILSYNIDASMDTSLAMHCVSRIRIRATADSRNVLPLELADEMRVVSAKVDGVNAEVYQRQSLRDGLVRNSGNELLLVVPSEPLAPGSEHEVEVVHEGKVVRETGDRIYLVGARATWYPGRGFQFASYDATFHYPESLNLVSAGSVTEDHAENGIHTTRRVPEGRLRLLGFNLGSYTKRVLEREGITLEVFANPAFEASLRPALPPPVVIPAPNSVPHSVRVPQMVQPAPATPENPADRIEAISTEMFSAIRFFRARFGEPPLKHIEVSPVPVRSGQGFAGMIYLPTTMYLDPIAQSARSAAMRIDEVFMGQLLRAHEVAHQWWGNIVTTDSYHHEWLMESLASYSALMFLESVNGPKALETGLDVYRAELLTKGPDGATAESRGPVVEGRRLESSTVPGAANAVLYGKGTWIVHMLRRRLGDANFLRMLAELRKRYEWKTVTTDEFRELCTEFLPAGSTDPKLIDFFDQWVYDTGMPTLKLTYTLVGRKLTGTIAQSDAPEDFSVPVPVEIRVGAGKPVVKVVRTVEGSVRFTVDVAGPGAKVVLDPGWSVLRR